MEENDNHEITKNDIVHLNVENENFNRPFTIDELTAVQSKLKNKKANGIDEIPNEVLKLSKISNLMLAFINRCFSLSVVPTLWQQAIITPIPKSSTKDPYMPLSYRSISLLSCMYKLYSSLINTRLCNFAEENDLIVDEQNGFRTNRSCIHHIHNLSSVIRNRKSDQKPTFYALIDFQKAFDYVDRDMLFYKPRVLNGITGPMFDAIRSIYSHSAAIVRVNNEVTNPF